MNENDLIVFISPNGESVCMSKYHLLTYWDNKSSEQPIHYNDYITKIAADIVNNNPHVTVWKVCPTGMSQTMGNLFNVLHNDDRYLERARKIATIT